MQVEDLHAIKQYLPTVLVSGPAQDVAKVVDHIAQILQRIDSEIAQTEEQARIDAEAAKESETQS